VISLGTLSQGDIELPKTPENAQTPCFIGFARKFLRQNVGK
jgi:hypothetical protein